MHKITSTGLATILGAGIFALAASGSAAAMSFEHVMNIGSEGTGEGQFKYVEDFDLSIEGHLLATDAAHAYVQVFDKTTPGPISAGSAALRKQATFPRAPSYASVACWLSAYTPRWMFAFSEA